jgi:hypothetical protein
MISQLSLFDTDSIVKPPIYKVGDWVKLRKKPMAASYLKKGDTVEIAAIHPQNGSIKFWNERSECWEFVYPEEVACVVDSVTSNAEVAVTESIPEPADSVTSNAEVAVTESIPEPADSVTSSAVSTYRPRGTARGIENVPLEYFRFSYRDGSKVRHVHVKGGNTNSPLAKAKVQEVRSLLASGVPPTEIAKLLRDKPSSV